MIPLCFPASETQMLPVKGCGLYSTLGWVDAVALGGLDRGGGAVTPASVRSLAI